MFPRMTNKTCVGALGARTIESEKPVVLLEDNDEGKTLAFDTVEAAIAFQDSHHFHSEVSIWSFNEKTATFERTPRREVSSYAPIPSYLKPSSKS